MKKDRKEMPRIHYGWIVIAMGMLTTIGTHGFGRMAYTLILPSMKDGLHFSYAELGLLGTGNFIGYLTLSIIGGFLASRFGSRVVITFGLILMGLTMILTGLAQSFSFAFLMRLFNRLRKRGCLCTGNGARFCLVRVEKERFCYWHRFSRNRRRHPDCRSHCPSYFESLWIRGLEVFLGLSGRGGPFDFMPRLCLYPEPAG